MNNKFFQIDDEEVLEKVENEEQTFDSNIFTSGLGYEASNSNEDKPREFFSVEEPEDNFVSATSEEDSAVEDEVYYEEPVKEQRIKTIADEIMNATSENDDPYEKFNAVSSESNFYGANIKQEEIEEKKEFNNDKTAFLSKEQALNNDIPQNPVYVPDEVGVVKKAKVNPFTIIGMLFGSILTPGSTVPKNAEKYSDAKKAMSVTLYIVVIITILSLVMSFVTAGFKKVYDINTGSYSTVIDFGNIANQDYIGAIFSAAIISFMVLMIFSLVYYASSFVKNKGIPFGKYVMVSNLALFPVLFAVSTLYPLAKIISYYLGFLVVLIFLIFSIFSYVSAIEEILEFKTANGKIFYNLVNFTIIVVIFIAFIVLFFEEDLNAITNIINTTL